MTEIQNTEELEIIDEDELIEDAEIPKEDQIARYLDEVDMPMFDIVWDRSKPSRPKHVPTPESKKYVVMQLAKGIKKEFVADALGMCDDTLRKYYKHQFRMAEKLDKQNVAFTMRQAVIKCREDHRWIGQANFYAERKYKQEYGNSLEMLGDHQVPVSLMIPDWQDPSKDSVLEAIKKKLKDGEVPQVEGHKHQPHKDGKLSNRPIDADADETPE